MGKFFTPQVKIALVAILGVDRYTLSNAIQ